MISSPRVPGPISAELRLFLEVCCLSVEIDNILHEGFRQPKGYRVPGWIKFEELKAMVDDLGVDLLFLFLFLRNRGIGNYEQLHDHFHWHLHSLIHLKERFNVTQPYESKTVAHLTAALPPPHHPTFPCLQLRSTPIPTPVQPQSIPIPTPVQPQSTPIPAPVQPRLTPIPAPTQPRSIPTPVPAPMKPMACIPPPPEGWLWRIRSPSTPLVSAPVMQSPSTLPKMGIDWSTLCFADVHTQALKPSPSASIAAEGTPKGPLCPSICS